MGCPVEHEAEEWGEVEVVGGHVEGADGGDRGPEVGVDGPWVDHRIGHMPAEEAAVEGRVDLAEGAIGSRRRERDGGRLLEVRGA